MIKITPKILGVLLVLNSIDAIATSYWIESGLAEEANPLMYVAYEWGPGWFFLIKTNLLIMSCFLLWKARHKRGAQYAIIALTSIYALLVGGHISWAIQHLQGLL